MRVLPGSALYFYTLDSITQSLVNNVYKDQGRLPVHAAIFTGLIARSLSCVVFLPITVVKTKFEALGNNRTYSSTVDALIKIKSAKGIRGLYSGLVPTLLRDAPFSAIYYGIYTHSKHRLESYFQDDIPSYLIHFSAGIFSGLLSTFITHPFDVIKSKIQAQNDEYYKGLRDTASKILEVMKFKISIVSITNSCPVEWKSWFYERLCAKSSKKIIICRLYLDIL